MISEFLDTILPGDPSLGLPPGSRVEFARYVHDQGIAGMVEEFFALLDSLAAEQAGMTFPALDETRRLDCIERAKRRNTRLATSVIVHCLKSYYTNSQVLRALSAGAVPPFPQGNALDQDDWSILEPVYKRGPIFRAVAS